MSESDLEEAGPEPKRGKPWGLVIALVLALVLGGGAFWGIYSGMVPLGGGKEHAESGGDDDHHDDPGHAVAAVTPAFVPLEPLIVSLGEQANARHLKVSVTVEVVPGREDEVTAIMPRINDVLNTYLRAIDERDLEVPRAMLRLRAHMLRRVQLVSPPDAVRDLLFQEFVLN